MSDIQEQQLDDMIAASRTLQEGVKTNQLSQIQHATATLIGKANACLDLPTGVKNVLGFNLVSVPFTEITTELHLLVGEASNYPYKAASRCVTAALDGSTIAEVRKWAAAQVASESLCKWHRRWARACEEYELTQRATSVVPLTE